MNEQKLEKLILKGFQSALDNGLEKKIVKIVREAVGYEMKHCPAFKILLGDVDNVDPNARRGLDDRFYAHLKWHEEEDKKRSQLWAKLVAVGTVISGVVGYFMEKILGS